MKKTDPEIRYHVSAPNPATHLFHVSMEIDRPEDGIELHLPVWTPGSYMVREFARHIQDFRVSDEKGAPRGWRKTSKDAWAVDCYSARMLRAEFDVYANDLTVRTSHLDSTHLFINAANLLPYVASRTGQPAGLRVDVPRGWNLATGLPLPKENDALAAADYDELVDSPVHAGPEPILRFEVNGVAHEIATWGGGNLDPDRLTADLTHVVAAQAALFGSLPYQRYVFMLMATDEGRGGLEHRNSCALIVPRFDFRPETSYERVLRLCSHEFFHTWNVKRIHPTVLGPFDYRHENYTRLLWAMEGITDYYALMMLRHAGIISNGRLLEVFGEWMSDLAETPGRHLQSLEEASFDAWIKYYRPDEHSANSGVSYYLKGALASLTLDMEIRRQTAGQHSLNDLMRLLWLRFGETGLGVPEDAYQGLVEEITGGDWSAFFDRAIHSRGDLDYETLSAAGIEVEWHADASAPEAWLGVKLRTENGRARVSSAVSDGPAWAAGLTAGDELLALDGYRVTESNLNDRLRDFAPGATVRLTLFRRDELLEVPVTLAQRPATRATLKRSEESTAQQSAVFEDWSREGKPAEASACRRG